AASCAAPIAALTTTEGGEGGGRRWPRSAGGPPRVRPSVDYSLPAFLLSRVFLERRSQQVRVNIGVEQFRATLEQLRPKLVLTQDQRMLVVDPEMLRNQVGHQRAVFRRRFSRHAVQRGRALDLPGAVAIIDQLLRQLIAAFNGFLGHDRL